MWSFLSELDNISRIIVLKPSFYSSLTLGKHRRVSLQWWHQVLSYATTGSPKLLPTSSTSSGEIWLARFEGSRSLSSLLLSKCFLWVFFQMDMWNESHEFGIQGFIPSGVRGDCSQVQQCFFFFFYPWIWNTLVFLIAVNKVPTRFCGTCCPQVVHLGDSTADHEDMNNNNIIRTPSTSRGTAVPSTSVWPPAPPALVCHELTLPFN